MSSEYKVRKGAGISLLFSKSIKGTARFKVPLHSHHMHYGEVLDLIQVYLEQKLAIEVMLHHPF